MLGYRNRAESIITNIRTIYMFINKNCISIMMARFNLALTKTRALTIILVVTSIMIIDSSIAQYFGSSNRELTSPIYVGIFLTFTILFVGIVILLLSIVKDKDSDSGLRRGLTVKQSYFIIALVQFLLFIVLLIIIQPIIDLQSYNILSLLAAVYISHISALFFLIFLTLTLIDWILLRRDKVLSLYTISFLLTAFAIMVSLVYATSVLFYQPSSITPNSFHFSLSNVPISQLANSFGTALDVVTIVSFVSVWIASAVLLNTYSRRIGKFRYWMIICTPIIYFLFPFEKNFVDIFSSLIKTSPVLFGLVNFLLFSATKQIAALFFSVVFLTAATLVTKHEMRKYLLISAVGIAILFGSIKINTLLYATYPPFGIITISFMPIGSYLVFTGLTISATLVARDKALRKEFYNTAISQMSLLKTIGVSEMENELIKSYKSLEKHSEIKVIPFEKDNVREILHNLVDDLDKENVREILHDVLSELYFKDNDTKE
jgi:hypothetical protein